MENKTIQNLGKLNPKLSEEEIKEKEQQFEMIENFFNGNISEATQMQLNAIPLINALFSEVNPIPVKSALNYIGYNFGIPRLPLTKMSIEKEKILIEEISKLK